MSRLRKAGFRRDKEYVVIKPIRKGAGSDLDVGDSIKSGSIRLRTLRRYHARNLIAVKGSEWAEKMIEAYKNGTLTRRGTISTTVDTPDDTEQAEGNENTEQTSETSETEETTETEDDEDDEDATDEEDEDEDGQDDESLEAEEQQG